MPNRYLPRRRGAFLPALTLLLLALALAGCGGGAESGFSLIGGEWQMQSYGTPSSQVEVPDPARYTLAFLEDNTVMGLADCNRFTGTYTQTGDAMRINPFASTRQACPPPSLDAEYMDLLERVVLGGINEEGVLELFTTDNAERLIFVNPDGATVVAEEAAGFLGLPWWLWGLLGLLLLALLWWLFGRGEPAMEKPQPVEPAALPEAPPPPEVTRTTVETPDDLTRIEGIGPQTHSVLQAAGIHTFAELAAASQAELRGILEIAGLTGAYGDPTTWPEQAALAAAGQWEALQALQDTLDRGRRM